MRTRNPYPREWRTNPLAHPSAGIVADTATAVASRWAIARGEAERLDASSRSALRIRWGARAACRRLRAALAASNADLAALRHELAHEQRPSGCQCTWETGDSDCPVHVTDDEGNLLATLHSPAYRETVARLTEERGTARAALLCMADAAEDVLCRVDEYSPAANAERCRLDSLIHEARK